MVSPFSLLVSTTLRSPPRGVKPLDEKLLKTYPGGMDKDIIAGQTKVIHDGTLYTVEQVFLNQVTVTEDGSLVLYKSDLYVLPVQVGSKLLMGSLRGGVTVTARVTELFQHSAGDVEVRYVYDEDQLQSYTMSLTEAARRLTPSEQQKYPVGTRIRLRPEEGTVTEVDADGYHYRTDDGTTAYAESQFVEVVSYPEVGIQSLWENRETTERFLVSGTDESMVYLVGTTCSPSVTYSELYASYRLLY
jgi:hypothetical protein